MKVEHAIINLSDYKQRLERLRKFVGSRKPTESEYAKMQIYSELVAELTPLIPVIEKAFGLGAANHANGQPLLSDYIDNLKLDI